ncbi:MAG: cell division protein ZapA [Alphaproteobacteria bacterium]
MATTTIRIHGKSYPIRTADGQEEHVQKLGHKLNEKVFTLSERLDSADKEYLLILAAIMILDDLSEKEIEPQELERELGNYKNLLKDAQNHIEALKLELEAYDPSQLETQKQNAVNQERQFFEDEQDLKFAEQRRLYESQIAELQNKIVELQSQETHPGELEDAIETSLKEQKKQLTLAFEAEKTKLKKEIENLQSSRLSRGKEEGSDSSLEVDPFFDRIENIAKKAEKA